MNASELRIGNWVLNTTTCEYMLVYPMMIHQLSEIERKHGSLDESNINPIPLTEEIILKCGFEKIADVDYSISCSINGRKSNIEINLENEACIDIYTINGNERTGAWVNTNNKYLHQLQNLYFALTGKELNIDL